MIGSLRRRAWWLAVAAAVSALALAACADDEPEQPEPPQQTQQQVEPPQPQRQSASSTARPAAAQQQQQSAAAAEPDQQDDPQEAEEQQAQEQADAQLAAVEAQYLAWTEDLESLALSVETESNLAGFELALAMELRLELEPLRVWMSLDLGPELGALMAAAGEESEEEAPEDLRIQILVSPEGAYLRLPGAGGWVVAPPDADVSALLAQTGVEDPENVAQLFGGSVPFLCADLSGGTVTEAEYEGQAVWEISCDVDLAAAAAVVDAILAAGEMPIGIDGEDVALEGVESMAMRLVIDRETGAALLSETTMELSSEAGAGTVFASAQLASYNEPLEFPEPTPLIEDAGLFGAAFEAGESSASSTPGQLSGFDAIDLETYVESLRAWAAETPRVSLSVRDEGSVDGEAQHLEVENKWDRDLGIYETATWVDGQAAVRLLWTREGLWWAEGEDAEWSVATPSQIGLSGDTVDSYLETGSGIPSLADSLEPFAAYGTATPTPEGGELTIRLSQAELSADPALASQAAEHLQNQSLWLLGEASVTEVYEFAIELRMDPFGRPRVFDTVGRFQTTAGEVQLRSTVVINDEAVQFSPPPQ